MLLILQHLAVSLVSLRLFFVLSLSSPPSFSLTTHFAGRLVWNVVAGRQLLCASASTNHFSQIEKRGLRTGECCAWWILRGPLTHSCMLYYRWSSWLFTAAQTRISRCSQRSVHECCPGRRTHIHQIVTVLKCGISRDTVDLKALIPVNSSHQTMSLIFLNSQESRVNTPRHFPQRQISCCCLICVLSLDRIVFRVTMW